MKISIITVFPEIYSSFLKISLISRAIENKLIDLNLVKLSDYCLPKERIDEPTCGPGVGMIIKPEVIEKAIQDCVDKYGKSFNIFFSPQGKQLDQPMLNEIADIFLRDNNTEIQNNNFQQNNIKTDHLILVCARYEGVDARVEEYYADLLLSIGDFVVMGGDLPAQIFLEAFLRLIPGVVGKHESVQKESFSSAFLDFPQYGLPVDWNGLKIPDIIRSGNHSEIDKWRNNQAIKNTIYNRFDWLKKRVFNKKDITEVSQVIPSHYVALMHTQIYVKDNIIGNNSITSLDIHDIARSCATYGIKNYFIVTPLQDQQKVLDAFLTFWKSENGKEYNPSRFQAVSSIVPAENLEIVLKKIKEIENKEPILISTSARSVQFDGDKQPEIIDYYSQGKIFSQNRPILFLFGTGRGLSDQLVQNCDYLLLPVVGLTDYNHLSVRSAAAIILDRWLGLNYKKPENLSKN